MLSARVTGLRDRKEAARNNNHDHWWGELQTPNLRAPLGTLMRDFEVSHHLSSSHDEERSFLNATLIPSTSPSSYSPHIHNFATLVLKEDFQLLEILISLISDTCSKLLSWILRALFKLLHIHKHVNHHLLQTDDLME